MVLGTDVAAVNAGLVAILSGVVAVAAWRALLHTGNRNIGFVVAAFAVLALRNLAKALALSSGRPESADGEFVFSLLDLLVVGLIAWPIFLRRGSES